MFENSKYTNSQKWSTYDNLIVRNCQFISCLSQTNCGGGFFCSKSISTLLLFGSLFFRCSSLVSQPVGYRLASGGAFAFDGTKSYVSTCCVSNCNGPDTAFGFILTCTSYIEFNKTQCVQNGRIESSCFLFFLDCGTQIADSLNNTYNKCQGQSSSGCIGHGSPKATMQFSQVMNSYGAQSSFYLTGGNTDVSQSNFVNIQPTYSIFDAYTTTNTVKGCIFVNCIDRILHDVATSLSLYNCVSTGAFVGPINLISCTSYSPNINTYNYIQVSGCLLYFSPSMKMDFQHNIPISFILFLVNSLA